MNKQTTATGLNNTTLNTLFDVTFFGVLPTREEMGTSENDHRDLVFLAVRDAVEEEGMDIDIESLNMNRDMLLHDFRRISWERIEEEEGA